MFQDFQTEIKTLFLWDQKIPHNAGFFGAEAGGVEPHPEKQDHSVISRRPEPSGVILPNLRTIII